MKVLTYLAIFVLGLGAIALPGLMLASVICCEPRIMP